MTEPTQPLSKSIERAPEVAVAPLNAIDRQDVGAAAAAFDKWLRKISDDYITLERLSTVAGSLPVVGNIMALIDAVMDMVGVIQKYAAKKDIEFLQWVSLGINLIGVVPVPPGLSAARMSLRPALHLVRQKLALGAKDIGAAVVEVLIVHLNATLAGEIETFVDGAMSRLAGILDDCADTADGVADDLIKILERCIGQEPLFDVATPAEAEDKLHTPQPSSWRRMLGALGREYKKSANYAVGLAASLLPQSAVAGAKGIIAHLTDFKPAFRGKLAALADEQTPMSIRWILMRLREAVGKHKKRYAAMVPSSKGADHRKNKPGHQLGASGRQKPATGDANACKLCPAKGGTAHSISFATGAETFTHLDFVLDAPLPIEWGRTYRSQLSSYDRGHLGARWLTPYSTRVDVVGQGKPTALLYHAADGRSHRYPWLAIGQRHHDPVEQITLTRLGATLLTLDFGKPLPEGEPSPWRETYELVDTVRAKVADQGKEHFRLIALHAADGAAIGLRYDHVVAEGPYAGEAVLSDIISKQGETIMAHAGTQIDAVSGRIRALWEIRDGELVRQLAAYDHDEHGDLVRAQDENGAAWQYEYDRHLVTRYLDRTGRGMNLAYDTSIDSGPHARAIREWLDDGSNDTRLEWDRNIRLTYVIDALGHETRYYYDIAGYTYRIVYPDGREEWFFRDDAKNVVRHIHADGSSEHYRYDVHGNLLAHTRADGSEVQFEYDGRHRVTAIRDGEGGTWKRDYDGQGRLVEETDPLGNKTEYAYDKAGRPVEVVDAKGGVKKLAYSPDGQLASYTDCSGHSSRWEYDERKRLVKRIDAAGNVTRYRYTPLSAKTLAQAHKEGNTAGTGNHPGQLEAVIHPGGSEELFRHDAEGRLLAHTDALQRTTAYRYTAAGLIGQRIDALGHSLHYRWDAMGRLAALENENGSMYRFRYDPVGRLLQEQGFDGKSTEYRYDLASGVLAETVEADVTTRLDFDPMGRLVQRRAAAPDQPEQVETFAYNTNGQLAEAKNEHVRLQWFYDAAGNLIREHQHYQGPFHPDRRTAIWRHHHDELNQRIGTIRPDGHRIDWLTYGAGHVHGQLLDGQDLVSFERNALYQETGRTQANGLVQTMKYDPLGRLVEQQLGAIKHANQRDRYAHPGTYRPDAPMQAAILRRYHYAPSGQLTSIEDSRRGQVEYRYDPIGRLLTANSALGHETFAFDPAGNIQASDTAQRKPVTRNVQLPKLLDNLLTEYAGVSYRYDQRGNVVARFHVGTRSEYAWDAFNRMTRATTWEGVTTFAYDPLGRRIAKHSQALDGTAVRNTTQTMYCWDGDTLALESSVYRGYAAGERTVHYVYERDSFVPLLQAARSQALRLPPTTDAKVLMAGNGGKYNITLDPLWNGEFEQEADPFGKDEIAFYQCDHLGTPQELTDHEGNVAWSALYKAWGQAKEAVSTAAHQASIRNPIRFQGQYEDAETGLFYNRYRYYDPNTARYLSQDPIRLIGGSTNLYSYPVPTAFVDPLGLVRTRPTDPTPGSLSDLETRCWYLKQESMIPCQINRNKSLKQQARQAHRLRNEARIRARLLMEDRQKAVGLYTGSTTGKPEPMLTWKQAMAKAESKEKTGSEAYAYIMGSAQQSRGSVNKNVIGDADCDQVLASLQRKFGCH